MESTINLVFVRSLQEIALYKTTILLWNEEDVRPLLTKCFFQISHDGIQEECFSSSRKETPIFDEIDKRIRRNVFDLGLPESIKEEILRLVSIIGRNLFNWFKEHNWLLYQGIYLPKEFSWTSNFTINQKETAKIFVEDERLNIFTRYKLACTYCFVKDIPLLWNKIPADRRGLVTSYDNLLVALPTRETGSHLTEEDLDAIVEKLEYNNANTQCKFYSIAFQYAACKFNKPATEFYLQKVTNILDTVERNDLLVTTVHRIVNSGCGMFYQARLDILCFLLSEMNYQQQLDVFKLYAAKIIRCFLGWPCKDFCSKLINQLLDYLSEKGYSVLLDYIAVKMRERNFTLYYSKLLSKVWQMGSPLYRNHVLNNSSLLFSELLNCNDLENIRMIVSGLTVAEKKQLLSSKDICRLCDTLLAFCDLDNLSFFLNLCLTNENEAMEFKRLMEAMKTDNQRYPLRDNHGWANFCQIMDDIILEFKGEKVIQSGKIKCKKPHVCYLHVKRKRDCIS